MSFSWKCPFHVFVAGFTTSSAIITTSILLYHYASRKSTSKRQSRLPDDYIESIYDKAFELATQLALKAGSNITEAISNKGKAVISVKGSTGVDFVTETDKENERMIFHELRKIFPDHVLIGEESSFLHESIPELTDEPTWIVDPIDGTTNFVHGFPFSCVSIALVVNKETVVGVVYDPFKDELFQSVKGQGSYLNGVRIKVSQAESINEALILTEIGYSRESIQFDRIFACLKALLMKGGHAARLLGSGVLDLCYVASGRLDIAYAGVAGEGWKPWDYAAGMLILKEAGGFITDIEGKDFHLFSTGVIAASSEALAREVASTINTTLNAE